MDENQKAEISALMQQHDARTGKRASDQRDDDEFATAFVRLRHEVIKPAMEQIAQQLKAGGHHAAIGETNPAKAGKKDVAATIRLEILPSGTIRERYGRMALPL